MGCCNSRESVEPDPAPQNNIDPNIVKNLNKKLFKGKTTKVKEETNTELNIGPFPNAKKEHRSGFEDQETDLSERKEDKMQSVVIKENNLDKENEAEIDNQEKAEDFLNESSIRNNDNLETGIRCFLEGENREEEILTKYIEALPIKKFVKEESISCVEDDEEDAIANKIKNIDQLEKNLGSSSPSENENEMEKVAINKTRVTSKQKPKIKKQTKPTNS
jgi:hypothetical protein